VSPKKKPQIAIQISADTDQNIITIMDNGNGISPELKDKIFEPKFTTKSSGMGLGLGIVKNIIEYHGGIISFISAPNKGTTFTIVLPKSI
jgi:signal transduction histidine kinase